MRWVTLLLLLMLPLAVFAQPAGFVRPDAYIKVTKDNAGTDVLEISMLIDKYPVELLKEQLANLSKELGVAPPRIIFADQYNPITQKSGSGNLRLTAALTGLVDDENHRLGLQALARAFAGAPAPNTVDGLMVQYAQQKPNPKMLSEWVDKSARVYANASPSTGVEYRITLLTQDPTKITIPEGAEAEARIQKKPVVVPEKSGPNLPIIIIVVIAALALGALVYSLLLRPKPRGRSHRPK